MGLLDDIQQGVVDDIRGLPNALRKAKLLATRWEFAPLREWCNLELQGYNNTLELPTYRVFQVPSQGDFANDSWVVKKQPLPLFVLPENIREQLNIWHARGALDVYMDLLDDDEKTFYLRWPPEYIALYADKFMTNASLYDAYRVVGRSQIVKLVNAVRDRLLDFTIQVREEVPEAAKEVSLVTYDDKEKLDKAMGVTINNHGTGNIAIGSERFTQNANVGVQPRDFASLATLLRESVGLPEEEIETLRAIVNEESPLERNKFGPRLAGWLGNVTQQIASGVVKAEVSTAIPQITGAINKFFGWG